MINFIPHPSRRRLKGNSNSDVFYLNLAAISFEFRQRHRISEVSRDFPQSLYVSVETVF